jgi:hypothetical protein
VCSRHCGAKTRPPSRMRAASSYWDRGLQSGFLQRRVRNELSGCQARLCILSTGMSSPCGDDTLFPGSRFGISGATQTRKPPPSPQPEGPPESTNLAKYQGREALTQRALHRPGSSDVDDSPRLAEWRLASPERGDARDAVPVIQVCRKRGDSRLGGSVNPQR